MELNNHPPLLQALQMTNAQTQQISKTLTEPEQLWGKQQKELTAIQAKRLRNMAINDWEKSMGMLASTSKETSGILTEPTGFDLDTNSYVNKLQKENAKDLPLNFLVKKYETGGKGYDAISHTKGDIGGASYGTYQFAAKTGGLDDFIKHSKEAEPLKKLKKGTRAFDNKWKELSQNEDFKKAQDKYAIKAYASPLIRKAKAFGVDVEKMPKPVLSVILSTGVQHGGTGGRKILGKVLKRLGKKASAKQIVTGIYNERMKKDAKGNLIYFSGNSKDVQEGVYNRLKREKKDALNAL